MRLAISDSGADWRGTESVTLTLATGLRDRGHDVIVFCRPASMIAERLGEAGFQVEPVLAGHGDFNPLLLWRCMRALARHRPQVVITQKDKDIRWTGLAARLRGIPVLVRHVTDRPLKNKLHYRFFYGWVPAGHVANSAATLETLRTSAPWLADAEVPVVHNGIDVESFATAPRIDLGLPPGALVIGFVGHFELRKGIMDFAQAWRGISAELPDAHAVIVGGGPRAADFQAALADAPRVHWLGFRPDISSVLKSIDIFVMPSRFEGFGLVLAEAMAAGAPSVVYNTSNLPELVTHGHDGFLVPPGDIPALTNAVVELGRDAELRATFGRNARATAMTRFSADRMVVDYEAIATQMVGDA